MSDDDQAVIDFAALTWRYTGARDSEIRTRFGCTATRYFQRLNALIDEPSALAYAPSTVMRLQRLRARRQMAR